ncbi:MAG: hypothetical protein LBG66_04735 [Gallionellaceae bacterium]|jgi:hypothetical protein|nr:hypothetical protein [Gallionellaceae bacterium]
MSLSIYQKIEDALSKENPVEALTLLVIELNNQGVSKEKIVEAFYFVDNELKNINENSKVDLLEEVIDMMTGYYVGRNLDLK